jgi:hypothetical protein
VRKMLIENATEVERFLGLWGVVRVQLLSLLEFLIINETFASLLEFINPRVSDWSAIPRE